MGALPAHCNLRWIVDSVEFQLHQLNVSAELLALPDRLRNGVAYACFDAAARQERAVNPFGVPRTPPTLLDAIRGTTLTDCEVPLAVLQWQTAGVQFIDLWSVRRRCAAGAEAEAMQNQFAEQLDDLRRSVADPETIEGRLHFRFLPPAGLLPVSSGAVKRFDFVNFFNGKRCSRPWFIEAGDVEAILAESAHYPPVDLDDPEMVWIYFVRQNRAAAPLPRPVPLPDFALFDRIAFPADAPFAVDTTPSYVLFANANLPFHGDARFYRSHFNFSNFG
jgi:hypothetical protein